MFCLIRGGGLASDDLRMSQTVHTTILLFLFLSLVPYVPASRLVFFFFFEEKNSRFGYIKNQIVGYAQVLSSLLDELGEGKNS